MVYPKKLTDNVKYRGERGPSPLGTTIFIGLRALDGFVLQRAIQIWNPLPAQFVKLGWHLPSPSAALGGVGLWAASPRDLSPFQAVLWGMAIGSAVKQIIWVSYISKEPFYADVATMVSVFNTVVNSANTLAFSMAVANPTYNDAAMYVGVPLYAIGISIELISELQRKWFKDDPKNQGKPYSGGLFGLARSINYFGYTLWRTGFALAAGGWVWGAVQAAVFSADFIGRAIPVLDDYCSRRYGVQWNEVKTKVPYSFCPGVC